MLEKVSPTEKLQFDIVTIIFNDISETLHQNYEFSENCLSLQNCKRIAYGFCKDTERKGTILIVAENPTDGVVYRYGNHGAYWEKIGETCGYA